MFQYENCICPYCGKPLLPSDELAVCPECGTPHHRSCYLEHGKCSAEALHGQNYEWIPPAGSKAEENSPNRVCLNCGAPCEPGTNFCNHCGAPTGYAEQHRNDPVGYDTVRPAVTMPYEIEKALREKKKLDGFLLKDWITYIGSNIGYYLYCFKMQDETGKKAAFTWSAMFFPEVYFLYRKVWGAAAVSFCLNLLLHTPAVFVSYLLPLGINLGLSTSFWNNLMTIAWILSLSVNFFWGLYAVYLFRRSALKRMSAMRRTCAAEEEFSYKLKAISGPSWIPVLILLAPYALIFSLLMLVTVLRV